MTIEPGIVTRRRFKRIKSAYDAGWRIRHVAGRHWAASRATSHRRSSDDSVAALDELLAEITEDS